MSDDLRAAAFPVLELRRYTITDGEVENFARCFDAWFAEVFEQLGLMVFGQGVERAAPRRFSWIRGFPDVEARARAGLAFYDGPLWKTRADYGDAGARPAGLLTTLDVPNNFPRHPLRSDGPDLVWLGVVPDERTLLTLQAAAERGAATLAQAGHLRAPAEWIALDPTPRSRLRWPTAAETANHTISHERAPSPAAQTARFATALFTCRAPARSYSQRLL